MNRHILLLFLFILFSKGLLSQDLSGTISGTLTDESTSEAIAYATIVLTDMEPVIGTTSNLDGEFLLPNIPVGRHDISIEYVGYSPITMSEVLVTNGKNLQFDIRMTQLTMELDVVTVRPEIEKEKAINTMALLSTKHVSMEEANRYAGGFDDPARLVTSYAGVSGPISNNHIVVRGNSPKGILWRMEGIAIPNPNHFAEIGGFGGGGITALSSLVMDDSDFFTGAFPAEYGNALSGVFDLSMRAGNNKTHEHTFQIGILGIDFASEGPLKSEGKSSYLFNYRYSTLGLVDDLTPGNVLGISYQDLSFKFNFPTAKSGVISLWGLGLIDKQRSVPDTDTTEVDGQWQYDSDLQTSNSDLTMGVIGLSHKITINKRGYLKSTLYGSTNSTFSETLELNDDYTENLDLTDVDFGGQKYGLSTMLNYRVAKRHLNRTGIILTHDVFDFDLQEAPELGSAMETFAMGHGLSKMFQVYSQSSIKVNDQFTINPGVHLLYFDLNEDISIEPRISMDVRLNDHSHVSLGYGLHSQVEKSSFYLSDIPTETGAARLNKDLGLAKAHHLVLSYSRKMTENLNLRIEPYYQYLFNVPVIPDSYYSFINLTDDFFIDQELSNEGTGENYGLELTLERYLDDGLYYLFTASLFDSKYTGGDGIKRDTRFARQYIFNLLLGKEWTVKEKNLFSANLKYSFLGGDLTHPVNEEASLDAMEVIEDLSKPYTFRNPDSHVMSLTFTYSVNKKKISSHWSLQLLNVLGTKEYYGHSYNFLKHTIDLDTDQIFIPNLSYRVNF